METEDIFETFQNAAISATALHSFVLGYHGVAKNKADKSDYPLLAFMFFVLPIVYNYRAMETFRSSNQLYTALIKDKNIVLGLHDRAIKMTMKTFEAINLAFSKKILAIDRSSALIRLEDNYRSKKLVLPLSMNNPQNRVLYGYSFTVFG